jgi:hypothetical protein
VTFNADKTQFNLEKVKAALKTQGFSEVQLLSGPAGGST